MINELARLLRRLDHCEHPVFAFDEVRRWPAGLLDRLVAIGLLREVEPAELIACDDCNEGHVLEPEIREYPDIGEVAAAKCPTCGRVQFSLDRLKQWGVHFDGLASLLAADLKLDTLPTPLVPGRINQLGSVATPGGMLDVFLARGLTWDDAGAVLASADRLTTSKAPIVLLPRLRPPAEIWGTLHPHMLMIAEGLHWDAATCRPDFGKVFTAVHLLRPPVPDERWLTVTFCAEQLLGVVSGIDLQKSKARVSDAASRNKFRTNGEKGNRRRIDRDSFSTWLNEQHQRDLDAADAWS